MSEQCDNTHREFVADRRRTMHKLRKLYNILSNGCDERITNRELEMKKGEEGIKRKRDA